MSEETFEKGIYELRSFGGEDDVVLNLAACKDAGYKPMFMPQLSRTFAGLPDDHPLRSKPLVSASIFLQGFTRGVYVHDHHYLLSQVGCAKYTRDRVFPGDKFEALVIRGQEKLPQSTKRVWTIPWTPHSQKSVNLGIDDLLNHLHVIPFFGGEEPLEQYIEGCTWIANKGKMSVCTDVPRPAGSVTVRYLFLTPPDGANHELCDGESELAEAGIRLGGGIDEGLVLGYRVKV